MWDWAQERELDIYGGVKNGSKVFSLSKECSDIIFTEIGNNEIRAELGRREERSGFGYVKFQMSIGHLSEDVK